MAEAISGENRGLTFAEQQMLRHGWQPGKGLGRHENGMSEPIKVKVKCDKGGVGHKLGEQFTFNWWDHAFNKASSNLSVESGQDGIVVRKVNDEEEKGMISNKRPLKAKLSKSMEYGCFVKSATLLSGKEQPERKASSSDDSSDSEDDDQKLDLSSATNLSDAELLKVCGGRTAHKGARHGLTMSAKLARLEQQEQEFMAKYGKKATSVGPCNEAATIPATQSPSDEGSISKAKRRKEKKRKSEDKEIQDSVTNGEILEVPAVDRKQKRKKKSPTEQVDNDAGENPEEDQNTDDTISKRKKKKKHSRNQEIEENGCEEHVREDATNATLEESRVDQSVGAVVEFQKASKKKHSKKNLPGKANTADSVVNEHHTDITDECNERCEIVAEVKEDCAFAQQVFIDVSSKKAKKKKKSSKTKESIPSLHEEDMQNEGPRETVPDGTEVEERTDKNIKAKKRKACEENENKFNDGDSTTLKKRKKGKRKGKTFANDC